MTMMLTIADTPPAAVTSPYFNCFLALVVIYVAIATFIRLTSGNDTSVKSTYSPTFRKFQVIYLSAFLFMALADWLQGPYIYQLYATEYHFSESVIACLFIIGFGSSGLFGVFIGSLTDRFGRRRMCLIFGVLYTVACILVHFNNLPLLVIGRLCGGIATSILFSAFEAWMVNEHHARGFPKEWISSTFSYQIFGNSLVAIAAGVIATFVHDTFGGPLAAFEASAVCLIVGSILVLFTWTENYGSSPSESSSKKETTSQIWLAWKQIIDVPVVLLIGIIQSSFEASMFIFVFFWTPALRDVPLDGYELKNGWVFASFMVSCLVGSSLFSYYISSTTVENMSHFVFGTSATALAACIIPNHYVRLVGFFIFEACVGVYFPCIGTMRSRYVEEKYRATIMNFFRIPLNVTVVLMLIYIEDIRNYVFHACCCLQVVALVCQYLLTVE